MGAVDLVIQVESPKSVARGLQRVGRAGHELGSTSKGRIFPKFRADLLESAVVARAMRGGEIEETKIPRNPLDVLAQQIVAIVADEEIEVDGAARARARRVSGRRPLPRRSSRRARHAAGRYPSDEFAELRRVSSGTAPRASWRARGCAQVCGHDPGTIADRGLYGVDLVDKDGRVGELDEEIVYETRQGQKLMLGASTCDSTARRSSSSTTAASPSGSRCG